MTRRDADRLQEEIEELFADLWQVPRFSGMRHGFRPNVDCFHTDEPHALTVVVELPGVDPQSVRVVAGERLLVVAGERRALAAVVPAAERRDHHGVLEIRARLVVELAHSRSRRRQSRHLRSL
jgi:HSP20 family molecular chaperone IbpA